MMQKLPYKDFDYTTTISLYTILNTPDDSDRGCYIVCDIIYTNSCKDRTEQLAIMPKKTKRLMIMNYVIEKERGAPPLVTQKVERKQRN